MQEQLDGMDSTHEDYEETSHTLAACKEISYAVTEGLVSMEEDDEGEMRFYPQNDIPV